MGDVFHEIAGRQTFDCSRGPNKTSVSLEDEFWRGMKEIAGKRLMTLSTLVDAIDFTAPARQSFVGAPALCAGTTIGAKYPQSKVARGFEI